MSGTAKFPASTKNQSTCVFCSIDNARVAWRSPTVLAAWDGYPVSPGHALVVPRRHAASWADLTREEKTAIITGIDAIRLLIAEQHGPDGFNVGFNDGPAAGQTVMHFHVHVIPRYEGDMPDPRGGVRWVLGSKAVYWEDGKQ